MTADNWPPRVAGVDLSMTRTGVFTNDGPVSIKSGPPADTMELTVDRLAMHAWAIMSAIPSDTDLVVVEGFAFGHNNAGTSLVHGLGWLMRYHIWVASMPMALVAPTTLKKYATGKGNASKDEVMARVMSTWPHATMPANNDEVDAMVLWSMGHHHITGDAPVDAHVWPTAMGKVDWPVDA